MDVMVVGGLDRRQIGASLNGIRVFGQRSGFLCWDD